MKDIVKYTAFYLNSAAKLKGCADRLQIWNLFCGLYEEPANSEQDHIHALAMEGRERLKEVIRLTLSGCAKKLAGSDKRGDKLLRSAENKERRELMLMAECRKLMVSPQEGRAA